VDPLGCLALLGFPPFHCQRRHFQQPTLLLYVSCPPIPGVWGCGLLWVLWSFGVGWWGLVVFGLGLA